MFVATICLFELHKLRKAINAYLELINEHNEASYFTNNNLGFAYQKLNELEEAEKCYQKGLEINPQDFEIFHKLANLALQRNDLQLAK